MKNFCLYNGKKIVKPETWNITSVELSSDYTSAIIQAESKSNKSEYNLDIKPLVSNQYKNGIDPYTATVVNSLTGVSDWILDPANNQIKYYEPNQPNNTYPMLYKALDFYSSTPSGVCTQYPSTPYGKVYYETGNLSDYGKYGRCNAPSYGNYWQIQYVQNPAYDPNAEREEKTLPLDVVAQQVISNAEGGDSTAQQVIVSAFNNITDGILTSDYSEFFDQNKQPK